MSKAVKWADVVGYEGLYQVSNTGLVRSIDRIVIHRGSPCNRKGHVLKQAYSKGRYAFVVLSSESKHKIFKVHRLVAKAFIPNPENLPEINHKYEDTRNNNVSNLEWCTRKYNMNYGTLPKRISSHVKAYKSKV